MYDVDSLDGLFAGSIAIIIFFVLIALAFAVFYEICLWKLFKKAGKKGWEALIPYYNTWVLIQIAGLNWWYFLIAMSGTIISLIGLSSLSWLTTLAGYGVNFFVFYNLGKKMHKSPVSTGILGAIFSGIMVPFMALSKNYQYDSSVVVSPNGPIGDNNTSSSNTNNTVAPEKYCLGCGQKLNPNTAFCENCGKKVE